MIQNIVDRWWEKSSHELKKGALIFAFIPHVDQVPMTLIPKGSKEADQHHKALLMVKPLKIKDYQLDNNLPVAAMALDEREVWSAYRAQKRPCLVLRTESTSPIMLIAPYYDVDKEKHGYNPHLIERIRHAEYPQFLLDRLPASSKESILRFDQIQPVSVQYYACEHSGYTLSDEAIELILDDWLQWLFYGQLPSDSLLLDYQREILSIYS